MLARYVRDEKLVTIEDAIRRMTRQPASVLNLSDRGRLEAGYFADVVVFDPAKIQDHADVRRSRISTRRACRR